jgi:hypothetical protein
MTSTARLAGLSIACATAWVFTTTALDARLQGGPVDSAAIPTPIEEALIEHACGALHPAGTLETEAYLACRNNRLLYLRTEFGRDLRRLSTAERRTIDSACSGLRAPRGEDAYLECLTARLSSLPGHGSRARPDAAGGTALPTVVPEAVALPPAAQPSSRWSAAWIGAALVALFVVAGGAFMTLKTRRTYGTCRTCGLKQLERGDLCPNCRHEAAETRRRAMAERVDHARAQEDEQRRQAEREDEQQQHARDEDARRRQFDEAQREQARQQEEEAQRQREEETRLRQPIDAAATDDEFDPYVVLGLPHEPSAADIESAYQAARLKYDLDLVADLGVELQEHFKRKALLVERAYQMLATRRSE